MYNSRWVNTLIEILFQRLPRDLQNQTQILKSSLTCFLNKVRIWESQNKDSSTIFFTIWISKNKKSIFCWKQTDLSKIKTISSFKISRIFSMWVFKMQELRFTEMRRKDWKSSRQLKAICMGNHYQEWDIRQLKI